MSLISSSTRGTRRAEIHLSLDESLEVNFYENDAFCGCINYSDHSIHYVNDAVENWMNQILTKETVKCYAKSEN
jgi:hypothetical protein